MRKAMGKVLLWALVAMLALAAMGGVSYLVGSTLLASSGRVQGVADEGGVLFHAGKYLTNLRDDAGRRYISVDITLELSHSRLARELEGKKPLLEHTIISVLRDKTYGELEGEGGMVALASDLMERINAMAQTGKVRRIFFTEFLIQ